MCGNASALDGWTYDNDITITNAGGLITYYQYNFTINTAILVSAGRMQPNGSDCRIVDASDNLLPFWNSTAFNTTSTKIWVNATSLPNGDTAHHLCYGNATAPVVYDGNTTFLQWHGVATSDFMDTAIVSPNNVIYEAMVRTTSSNHLIVWRT